MQRVACSWQSAVCSLHFSFDANAQLPHDRDSGEPQFGSVFCLFSGPEAKKSVASCQLHCGCLFFFCHQSHQGGRGGESAKSGNSAKNLFHFIQPD